MRSLRRLLARSRRSPQRKGSGDCHSHWKRELVQYDPWRAMARGNPSCARRHCRVRRVHCNRRPGHHSCIAYKYCWRRLRSYFCQGYNWKYRCSGCEMRAMFPLDRYFVYHWKRLWWISCKCLWSLLWRNSREYSSDRKCYRRVGFSGSRGTPQLDRTGNRYGDDDGRQRVYSIWHPNRGDSCVFCGGISCRHWGISWCIGQDSFRCVWGRKCIACYRLRIVDK